MMSERRIPLHPGAFLRQVYIEEAGLSQAALADALGVNKGTLSRLLNGQISLSPVMAVRLHRVLGRSAESWLRLQQLHDLAAAEREMGDWQPHKIFRRGRWVEPPR